MIFQKIAILLYCHIAGNKKNNLTIQQYGNCKPQEGFTLIELMVVLSVTAILSTLGIAGFTTYSQIQALQSATNDVATILSLAKSRAQSQVKPSALCDSFNTLDGYRVEISEPKSYTLYLRCSGIDKEISEEAKVLAGNINFGSSVSFFFPIQTGGVQTAGQVVISGYGRSKTITVSLVGGISIL